MPGMKPGKLPREAVRTAACVALLAAVTLVVFLYTVRIRSPWFGRMSLARHHWLSGSTLKFTKCWYHEGPFHLWFAMMENPASVEFPDLLSREPYVSYPPGAIIPFYLVCKVIGHEPSPPLLMGFNLANHLLIALLLSLGTFFFLRQLRISRVPACLLGVIPALLELLLPGPMYWHQNVFFSDQAVILPFAALVFLEILRDQVKSRRALTAVRVLQWIVLFYGTLTDWVFLFIAAALYGKRLFDGSISRKPFRPFVKASLRYWLPVILAVVLFICQLTVLGVMDKWVQKGLERSGLKPDVPHGEFFETFWLGHIATGYGKWAIFLLWGSLAVFGVSCAYLAIRHFRKEPQPRDARIILYLIGLVLLPCFTQVYVFRPHSIFHEFSALKFSPAVAMVPLVLVPLLLRCLCEGASPGGAPMGAPAAGSSGGPGKGQARKGGPAQATPPSRWGDLKLYLMILCIVPVVGLYVKIELPGVFGFFSQPTESYQRIGSFLAGNTSYKDVVFSPNLVIDVNPPIQLAYSGKRVHFAASAMHVYDKVSRINADLDVDLLFMLPPDAPADAAARELFGHYLFRFLPESEAKSAADALYSIVYDVKESGVFCLDGPNAPQPPPAKLIIYRIRKADFLARFQPLWRAVTEKRIE